MTVHPPIAVDPCPSDVPAPEAPRPGWWANRTRLSLLVVVLGVLGANVLPLTGIVDADPMAVRADLLLHDPAGWLPGNPTIDPNDGFTSQALGRQAADQWFSGEVPYWNHYEGVGAPLAGGMQSAAFFLPFILLLRLANGLLYFHVALEVLAALGAYLLLRRLRVGHAVAVAGGIAFGVSGTMAWLTNAVMNPIAFLPWLVLGIELVLGADDDDGPPSPWRRWVGPVVIALAVSGSLYAGFPEIAYLDGLLAGAWAVLRLVQRRHDRFLRRLGNLVLGGLAGLLLAAPILVAFLTYLSVGHAGSHDGTSGEGSLLPLGLPAMVLPYVYGPIFGFTKGDASGLLALWWSNVGGYVPMAAVALTIVGLFGRRERGLKILLVVWSVICLGKIFGVPVVSALVNLVPAVRLAAFYRYSQVMIEFSVIVVAALAIDEIVRGQLARWKAVAGGSLAVGVVLGAAALARYPLSQIGVPEKGIWAVASVLGALGVVAVVIIAGLMGAERARLRRALLGGVLVAESIVFFVLPQLSAPRDNVADLAPVTWLQAHQGTASFFSLSPISPNYGSYFGIRSANVNNLPIPQAYADFILEELNRNAEPAVFTGWYDKDPAGPTGKQELLANLGNYAEAGVRFVVARRGVVTPAEAGRAGLSPVFADTAFEIFEVPGWRPYLEPTGESGCRVVSGDFTGGVVDCPAPARLLRRELSLPGWTAAVNGEATPITSPDGLFQEIALPAGRSTVTFSFRPPGAGLSWVLLALGVLILVGLAPPVAGRLRLRGLRRGKG
jgi:hypothetical protein